MCTFSVDGENFVCVTDALTLLIGLIVSFPSAGSIEVVFHIHVKKLKENYHSAKPESIIRPKSGTHFKIKVIHEC